MATGSGWYEHTQSQTVADNSPGSSWIGHKKLSYIKRDLIIIIIIIVMGPSFIGNRFVSRMDELPDVVVGIGTGTVGCSGFWVVHIALTEIICSSPEDWLWDPFWFIAARDEPDFLWDIRRRRGRRWKGRSGKDFWILMSKSNVISLASAEI